QTEPSQPTISFTEGSQTSNEGSKIVMKCTSTGVPTPTFTWLRNNQPLPTLSRYQLNNAKTKLTINPSHREDNDIKFTCHVTNVKASKTEDITLNIRFKPPLVSLSGYSTAVKSGDMLTLTCETDSSNPAAVITWYKDGDIFTGNSDETVSDYSEIDGDNGGTIRQQDLEIRLLPSHNMALYQCKAVTTEVNSISVDSTTQQITVY
ncbi:lachesin-like, partial [Saccoglossus kowalevskii]